MQFGRTRAAALGGGVLGNMPAPLQSLALLAGLLALAISPAEAGAHISDGKHGSDHEARLQVLRDNVQKAMLDLYMENADMHMNDANKPKGMLNSRQPFGQ